MTKIIYGKDEIAGALAIMTTDILARDETVPLLIGIRRGGLVLCDRLSALIGERLGHPPHQGVIDINLYRDDWTRARALPKVGKTEIPFRLDDKRVILVDDVLFTGRTVRAALEALVDFGRPLSIELAVLVDRGHREMPIEANYAPFKIITNRNERVNVNFKGHDGFSDDEIVLEP
ncbi:MAG: bifunctional pyr operon transcriptional regulator/uracil phosphoribosyltransferase PyrR [Candidatus Adiutrix sp.]